jgi:hypothetical protein
MPWKVVNRTGKHEDKPYMAIPKDDEPAPGWRSLSPAVEGTKEKCAEWMKAKLEAQRKEKPQG